MEWKGKVDEKISGHTTYLRNKFYLAIDEESRKHPNICWAPKLHLSKARFIIAAPQCSLKPLSNAL